MKVEEIFFNIADYKLQKTKLGEGTFGTVYISTNNTDNEQYATKIIKTNGNFTGNDKMLLIRESLILNKLKHLTIVKFKGLNFQSFLIPKN